MSLSLENELNVPKMQISKVWFQLKSQIALILLTFHRQPEKFVSTDFQSQDSNVTRDYPSESRPISMTVEYDVVAVWLESSPPAH